ncbi:hypothetical protein BJY00DRAFT_296595 [Aspergillus carlsbadensis]|nr:hypothetical protein BJY00DRAFT_296595 [Aspergillus carlsbadensis]
MPINSRLIHVRLHLSLPFLEDTELLLQASREAKKERSDVLRIWRNKLPNRGLKWNVQISAMGKRVYA